MKKILALILTLSLILAGMTIARAETMYAYVKTPTADGTVYVRSVAGAGQPILGVANNGETLIVLKKGNTWHKVRVVRTGLEGYMYGEYIVFINSTSSASSQTGGTTVSSRYTADASVLDTDTVLNQGGTVVSSDGFANLRWGPGTGYGIITSLSSGRSVWVLERNGSWYRCVTSRGEVGYISQNLITLSEGAYNNPGGRTGVIRSGDGSANVRSGAGMNSPVVYTLFTGNKVSAHDSSGDWLCLSHQGDWNKEYVWRALVRFYHAAKATGNVNVRSGPATSYGILGSVPNGANVTLLATDCSFCRVDTGSQIGYVSAKYLSY